MPERQLAARDVDARFQKTIEATMQEEAQSPAAWTSEASEEGGGAGGQSQSLRGPVVPPSERPTRRARGVAGPLAIMFGNGHVGELQPRGWRAQILGRGAFGCVYRAVWRGQPVAVRGCRASLTSCLCVAPSFDDTPHPFFLGR
jgi:hypothetical protein